MKPTSAPYNTHATVVVAICVGLGAVGVAACGVLLAAPADEKPAVSFGDVEMTLKPPVAWLPAPLPVPDAEATTEAEMKPYTEQISGANVTFDMVPIRGGKFKMGSPDNEPGRQACEGPQFEVEVEPFWMGKCEVTWEEYDLWAIGLDRGRRRELGVAPSDRDRLADAVTQATLPYVDPTFGMGRGGYPAILMEQLAAKVYCKWLSAKTGRYYRLPTEAEWEYACRAGTTTAYSFGDNPAHLDEYAWYIGNCKGAYHKVGEKKPNPWGLYDMHGNVVEWVLDAFTPEGYKPNGQPAKNPVTVPQAIYPRVVRGGSWMDEPTALRSAARRGSTEDWKSADPQFPKSVWWHTNALFLGFRVVRPLRLPSLQEAARYDIDEAQAAALKDYLEYLRFKELWKQNG